MIKNHVGAFEAKTHLSSLLERLAHGRTFVITRRGRPIAELRPVADDPPLRYGCDRGTIVLAHDFDPPLPGMGDYVP